MFPAAAALPAVRGKNWTVIKNVVTNGRVVRKINDMIIFKSSQCYL